MSQRDPTFSEFYASYLAHHCHPANRALHLLAKLLVIAGIVAAAYERSLLMLLAVPVLAVAPCWLGHLCFEGNRPVSWTQPAASLLGTLSTLCGFGRGRRTGGGGRPPGHDLPLHDDPPRAAAGGRAYYSFLADLRMCGEMLAGMGAARSSKEPT